MRYRRILPLALAATLLLSGCDAVEEAVASVMARVSSSGSSEKHRSRMGRVMGMIADFASVRADDTRGRPSKKDASPKIFPGSSTLSVFSAPSGDCRKIRTFPDFK